MTQYFFHPDSLKDTHTLHVRTGMSTIHPRSKTAKLHKSKSLLWQHYKRKKEKKMFIRRPRFCDTNAIYKPVKTKNLVLPT